MGAGGAYTASPMAPLDVDGGGRSSAAPRSVWRAVLSAGVMAAAGDVEYYAEVAAGQSKLHWPAGAPILAHTVIVV